MQHYYHHNTQKSSIFIIIIPISTALIIPILYVAILVYNYPYLQHSPTDSENDIVNVVRPERLVKSDPNGDRTWLLHRTE